MFSSHEKTLRNAISSEDKVEFYLSSNQKHTKLYILQ